MRYNYKTSLRDLRSSLKHRSRDYLLENTLHGFPYFMDSTRPKWERIMWLLLTLASFGAISAIIVIIWGKFQREPTITGLDMTTHNVTINFPEVFICFDWAQLNHSRLHKDEMYVHEQLYYWKWGDSIDLKSSKSDYRDKNDFHSTFEAMIPACKDIFSDCIYKGIKIPCEKLFIGALASVGACCKFKTLEPLKVMDLSWILEFKTVSSSYPWRIYFTQNEDSTPKPGERPITKTDFPIIIQYTVDVTYNTPDIRYLTLHQRGCQYNQETSLNDCEINCFATKLLSRCHCKPWFLSTAKTECPISKYFCLNVTTVDLKQCDCWLSCDHTSYTIRSIMKSTSDTNRIMLRNWPTAIYKREMRFGYLDLLVSFGGIAGLFLGYSFLVSVELGYYFSLRTYCGAVVSLSRKKYNIMTVHVVEQRPVKVDVSPRYYQYVD